MIITPNKLPLQFEFKGYSVWLEPVQNDKDLSLAIETASQELGVLPIPMPHVTAIYGMTHLSSEMEAIRRFRNAILECTKASAKWPPLKYMGLVSDVEWDGINGGTMDMCWMEITFATSDAHEAMLDRIYNVFYDNEIKVDVGGSKEADYTVKTRSRPWTPHASIAYDNPGPTPIPMEYLLNLIQRFPTLTSTQPRDIAAISLWNTAVKLEQWKCIDRIEF